MTRVEYAEYEKFPSQAREMRKYGQDLNKEMFMIYGTVKDMHNWWYGPRYNDLVEQFNKLIPSLNEILQLVVTTFPSTLEEIANNMSQANNRPNVTSVDITGPKKIPSITLMNDVGMRFITAQVENEQTAIIQGFKKSKDYLNNIQGVQKRLVWESRSATNFNDKFTRLKDQIFNELDSLEKEFKNLMEQTKADMKAMESANTVQ